MVPHRAWVGVREDHRIGRIIDHLARGAIAGMRAAGDHADARHLVDHLSAEVGETAVVAQAVAADERARHAGSGGDVAEHRADLIGAPVEAARQVDGYPGQEAIVTDREQGHGDVERYEQAPVEQEAADDRLRRHVVADAFQPGGLAQREEQQHPHAPGAGRLQDRLRRLGRRRHEGLARRSGGRVHRPETRVQGSAVNRRVRALRVRPPWRPSSPPCGRVPAAS